MRYCLKNWKCYHYSAPTFFLEKVTLEIICFIFNCSLYLSRHFILVELICANQSESKFLSLPPKSWQNVAQENVAQENQSFKL